jgi:hypothetical protein
MGNLLEVAKEVLEEAKKCSWHYHQGILSVEKNRTTPKLLVEMLHQRASDAHVSEEERRECEQIAAELEEAIDGDDEGIAGSSARSI